MEEIQVKARNTPMKKLLRRRSSHDLEPLLIPPYDDSQPVIYITEDELEELEGTSNSEEAQVVEEGRELFQNFLHEEIQKCPDVAQEESPLKTPPGYKNPLWAKAGRDLRLMADKFARTEERKKVQQRAREMGTSVTFEQFRDFLSQMFSRGGVTQERIVVLFCFCSDVAIQALRVGRDLFTQFLTWSLNFITDHICSWVYRHGGWAKVLYSPFNSVLKLTLWVSVALVTFGALRYFRR